MTNDERQKWLNEGRDLAKIVLANASKLNKTTVEMTIEMLSIVVAKCESDVGDVIATAMELLSFAHVGILTVKEKS